MAYKIKYGGSSTYAGYHTPNLYTSDTVYETAFTDNDLKVYSPGLAPATTYAHDYVEFELGKNAIIRTTQTFFPNRRITGVHREVKLGDFLYNQQGELEGGNVKAVAIVFSYPSKKDWETNPLENEWQDNVKSTFNYNGSLSFNETPFYGEYYDEFWRKFHSNTSREFGISDDFKQYFPDKWQDNPLGQDLITSPPKTEPSIDNEEQTIEAIISPQKFNKKSADKITNFNTSTDTLKIDTKSFGLDSAATFASGKNKKEVKKKLAKQDFDFLYDQKKGGLYFNENGSDKGFGDGGIIAILKGAPDLTSGNLEFI